jgi:hypothetical protein
MDEVYACCGERMYLKAIASLTVTPSSYEIEAPTF